MKYDVVVVGAGIVGLAHAWMAAKRGLSVLVLDRSSQAVGATIRNFGMIWPVGQPSGELRSMAMKSRAFWLELKSLGALPVETCGSLHVAHNEDELQVLTEYTDRNSDDVNLLSPEETLERSPIVRKEGLCGAMWSSTELRVDPRNAARQIASWLAQHCGVTFKFDTSVAQVAGEDVRCSCGTLYQGDRIVVCSGSDLRALFPGILSSSGLKLCKLQMLETRTQSDFSGSPHIASGLTLRHYQSFQDCPTLASLKRRIAQDSPELDEFGIHVMASLFPDGRIVLGDSHEYDERISPFDKPRIDELMIQELKKILTLENWTITSRWSGIYSKHPQLPVFESTTECGAHLCIGTGGAGMTMAFGIADRAWQNWIEKTN